MDLIIVESPHKAQTISGFLDSNYTVVATKGHIKNLPRKEYAILETEGVFSGKWEITSSKKGLLHNIKKIASEANKIYVATDDDREGERIAWDVIEYLELKGYYRIVFHEITKKAIIHAIENATEVDKDLVNSQIARRIIDRILGYKISAMLRDFFKQNKLAPVNVVKNMGVGRVSAAALALIIQNEAKIKDFEKQGAKTYKKIRIDYMVDNIQFSVKSKVMFDESQEDELKTFMGFLKNHITTPHIVASYKRETKEILPPPPLTTSWLLRGVSSRHGYLPKKTMKIAQQLYEGIVIKNDHFQNKRVGLITYIRTDSYNISNDAIYEMTNAVYEAMGDDYTRTNKIVFENKNTSAQEAHEAIRPIHFTDPYLPKNLKKYLNEEQYNVYSYIFYRAIALQIKNSIYDNSSLTVSIGGNNLYSYANKLEFDGWEKIGKYWKEETGDDKPLVELPRSLFPGKELKPINVVAYDYVEKSPPRYGVGRFITILESNNIARPSTVATVSETLESKGYIKIINSIQHPLELGQKVYGFLEEYAEWMINLEHAQAFEETLDKIAKGEIDKNKLIAEYEELAEKMAKQLNYTTQDKRKPEEWMLEKAKKIATKKGEILSSKTLSSYGLLLSYIKTNEKRTILGKCPKCKNDVLEGEKSFYCKDKECNFTLWKSNLIQFFERFEKYIPEELLPEYISIILKKKKCYVPDLYNKKTTKTFSAFIAFEYNETYKKWGLKFIFPKSKAAEIEDKYKVHLKEKSLSSKKDLPKNDDIKIDINLLRQKAKERREEKYSTKNTNVLEEKLKKAEEEKRLLLESSRKDHLTRAYNRKAFDTDIVNYISKKTVDNEISMLFLDIDHFKKINDTFGHQAGDYILSELSNIVHKIIREKESLKFYRYGGEEFCLLSVGKLDRTGSITLANEIRKAVETKNFSFDSTKIDCTVSIGVAFLEENDTIGTFIKKADEAMYTAKKNGRNRIEY